MTNVTIFPNSKKPEPPHKPPVASQQLYCPVCDHYSGAFGVEVTTSILRHAQVATLVCLECDSPLYVINGYLK